MKIIVVFIALVALVSAKRIKKPIDEYFKDFAGEEDLNLIIDDEDETPTNFVGDVMKAQTTSIKTLTGSKKFNYNFETQNGIKIASIGKLKDSKTFVVTGSYTYTGADGKRYRVRYTADEFGYHPVTEEDNEPDVVINPPPAIAQLAPPRFSPFTSLQNGNKFKQNESNGKNGFGNNNGHKNSIGGLNSHKSSRDRSGKSLEEEDLVFNKDFVTASVAPLDTPSRLYLPSARTYLPPPSPRTYLPPKK